MTDAASFETFHLIAPLLATLAQSGHKRPSPIQAAVLPVLLEGRDALAVAQTGSGKTAAYVLPILQRLAQANETREPGLPHALILAPTRELVTQIASVCRQLGRQLSLRSRIACGGMVREPQIAALKEGVDILVATPGRLIDLLDGGHLRLDAIKILVLDEADQMLDEDFLLAMARLDKDLPRPRQTVLCSATMPDGVKELSRRLLYKPEIVELPIETVTPKRIKQSVVFVEAAEKSGCVATLVQQVEGRIIVFVRTKANVEKLAKTLRKSGIKLDTLHGDRTQGARNKALEALRRGEVQVLITTDIAARGLDINDIVLVINYDLPDKAENYVHRIGRTARAGKRGAAITLCDIDERAILRQIEKTIGYHIKAMTMDNLKV
ncbi:DEAD/DEAH box helicase [Kozakia baliensis]|uniref:DEAD/DEAH box helicase n=1 Tax=Kozakia baliensis TaxID=153496 RepID=UPI0009F5F901|nr:DEAD/DEAH box helicase [Kozakia baliensis]